MKRILSLILVVIILGAATPVAFAFAPVCTMCGADNDFGPHDKCGTNYADGYCLTCFHCVICAQNDDCDCNYCNTNNYTAGTQVVFEAMSNESYTITVPAKLNPGQSGTVTLVGSWPSNKIISVTAEPTVTLTNSILASDQKVLDVTFLGISKAGDDTAAQTFTESVSVEGIENALFGTWSGKFNYNVDTAPSSTAGDILDNEWPIAWNTKAVVNNTSLIDGGVVKISNSAPSLGELQSAQLIATMGDDSIVLPYAGGSEVAPGCVAGYYSATLNGGLEVFSAPVAGNYTLDGETITVSEPGLYVANIGADEIDIDFVLEEKSFLLEWSKTSIAGSTKVNTVDPEERFALVSSEVLPQAAFTNTTFLMTEGDETATLFFDKIETFDYGYDVYYNYNGQSIGLIHVFETPGTARGLVADVPGCYFAWVENNTDFSCVVG